MSREATRPAASALRRWGARGALVVGGLLGGLVLAELAGRAADLAAGGDLVFAAPQSYPPDLYLQDGEMRYPNPRFAGTVASYGYATTPRFSRWGVRGTDPTPGARAWIGVGDSFTIALQVEEDETFLARAAAAAGAAPINAGVDGYSTWQATLRAAQLGRRFPPERVILAFFTGNDLGDNQRRPGGRTPENPGQGPGEPGAPDYQPPPRGTHDAKTSPFRWLRDHSVLAAAWDVRRQTRRMRATNDPAAARFRSELAIFTEAGAPELARILPETRAAFAGFRDTATRLGAAPLVVVIPPAFVMDRATAEATFASVDLTATPALDGPQVVVVAAAREAALPICDATEPLRAAAAAGDRPYLPFDGHLSVAGHAVVADAIERCLAE